MSTCFFGYWFSQLAVTVAWSFPGFEQMKSDFIYCSQTLVKLVNFSLQCEEWIVCFIPQFSLGLFESKELRSVLGHIFKGALIMSVLLFLLSNYKAWKFPLRKTASAFSPGNCVPLAKCKLFCTIGCIYWKVLWYLLPIRQSNVSCLENEIGLNSLLLTAIIWESLNLKVNRSITASAILGVTDYYLYQ